MKYKDLIQFDPIESIIQLKDANKEDRARTLVKTYVISEDMGHRLAEVLLPALRFDTGTNAKGLLIVGNYGSGKSHLMSVVSALAEHADLLDLVEDKRVKKAAATIAGKFKVIRIEIGSTEMGLREILTKGISSQLKDLGVKYDFPSASNVAENKTAFEEMMAAFHKKYPDQGLFVVVDELLDYLRSRQDQPLILDLGFLREIGEVCKDLRLRFMAGVQEAIFDSGRFAHVAESLSRVKDRFEQVRIATNDVTYVVANRLLKKDAKQKELIRQYLAKYAKFYEGWTQRLDQFVDLFPVHPDYIELFEKIPVVEKRGVLQVLSADFKKLRDEDLPEDMPGLIAADNFWKFLLENPAVRANPDVKETMDCSNVLVDKVKSGFPKNRKMYQPMAIRIIQGLSVHRLTTGDIHAPIGLTPEELRDRLCLYHPMAEEMSKEPATDLLGIVDATLREIRTTVSGQFLSHNEDNRQYYLDLKKTEDYDAIIEKKVETVDKFVLDRAYYNALQQLLECTSPSSFGGFRIWEQSIEWTERKATKQGWLFFGVPSERSTAQPPRDFYLYFIQPFEPPKYQDERKADEVFFKLEVAEAFEKSLKHYAAALELQEVAVGVKKQNYGAKAEAHFRDLQKWLRANFLTAIQVTHEGKTKKLNSALSGANAAGMTGREQVFTAASRHLAPHFSQVCGEYPHFSRLVTFGREGNVNQVVQDALRGLHSTPTQMGAAILDALGLMDGEKVSPYGSPYAKFILELLKQKGHGQVLNRSELIQQLDGIDYFVSPGQFRLEPELLLVVLGAMVHSGDLVIGIPGKEFTATDLPALSATPLRDLLDFKHVKKPKDWNLPALTALFELLGLNPGQAKLVTQNENDPVIKLNTEVLTKVQTLVKSKQEFQHGIPFWGAKLIPDQEVVQVCQQIESAKLFLESLQAYNTPGKLKNFKPSKEEIEAHAPALKRLAELEQLKSFADSMSTVTSYLTTAESNMPEGHPWRAKCLAERKKLQDEVAKPENRASDVFRSKALQRLTALKKEYIDAYLKLYQHARLDMAQDRSKAAILKDSRFMHLRALATIPTMNLSQVRAIEDEFGQLKPGLTLTAADLDLSAVAGDFYPVMERADGTSATQRLANLEQRLDQTYSNWVTELLRQLEDPTTKKNIKLLKPSEQKLIDTFLKDKELPDLLDKEFVPAVQQALKGLIRISVSVGGIQSALFPQGSPATADEFKERFATYVDELLKGQDRSKIRLVPEP